MQKCLTGVHIRTPKDRWARLISCYSEQDHQARNSEEEARPHEILAADISQRQADLAEAERNLAAARNYNESDFSGGDHGLDDFVNNFLDPFDPAQYGLGDFDETASLPFIFPATDWDQSDETNAESEDSTPALGINEALEQAFEPITQLINSIGSPQDATQLTYPPGFSPADLGIPDYAQQLGDQQGDGDSSAQPFDSKKYDDYRSGDTESLLGEFGMLAGLFAVTSGLAGAALAAIASLASRAWAWATAWAGVGAWNLSQKFGSMWQSVKDFLGIGGGAAPEAAAADVEAATAAAERAALEAEVAATRANTLHHIFDNPDHALDSFVKQYGSQENALQAVEQAANRALQNGQLTPNVQGILPSGNLGNIIDVAGTQVRLIGGRVINGVVQVSSFSRRGL